MTSKICGSTFILQVPTLVMAGFGCLPCVFSPSVVSFFFDLYVDFDQYFSNMPSCSQHCRERASDAANTPLSLILCHSESDKSVPCGSITVGRGLPSTSFVGRGSISGGGVFSLTTFLGAGVGCGVSTTVGPEARRFAAGSLSLAEARRFSAIGWLKELGHSDMGEEY